MRRLIRRLLKRAKKEKDGTLIDVPDIKSIRNSLVCYLAGVATNHETSYKHAGQLKYIDYGGNIIEPDKLQHVMYLHLLGLCKLRVRSINTAHNTWHTAHTRHTHTTHDMLKCCVLADFQAHAAGHVASACVPHGAALLHERSPHLVCGPPHTHTKTLHTTHATLTRALHVCSDYARAIKDRMEEDRLEAEEAQKRVEADLVMEEGRASAMRGWFETLRPTPAANQVDDKKNEDGEAQNENENENDAINEEVSTREQDLRDDETPKLVVCSTRGGGPSCGIPRRKTTDAVLAVVVLRPGAATITAGVLVDHCRTLIAGYKKPRHVVFADEIVKLPSGKIDKVRLRKLYGGQPA